MAGLLAEMAELMLRPGMPEGGVIIGRVQDGEVQVKSQLSWLESDVLFHSARGESDKRIGQLVSQSSLDIPHIREQARACLPGVKELDNIQALQLARRLHLLHPESEGYVQTATTDPWEEVDSE